MAASGTIPPEAILNPYTPLAFLSPAIAEQYQVVGYVYVASLAVSTLEESISVEKYPILSHF